MKNVLTSTLVLTAVLFSGLAGLCQSPEFPADAVSEIKCAYEGSEKFFRNEFKGGLEAEKGTYSYKIYLPPAYYSEPEKQYPCIFICAPHGNPPMDNLSELAKEREIILVMLEDSRNGPLPAPMGNFLAAHDDAVKRFRIRDGMKYTTGFTGSARTASLFAGLRGGFGGIILQTGGFAFTSHGRYVTRPLENNRDIGVVGLFASRDKNAYEIDRLEGELPEHTRTKLFEYEGGHGWAPPEQMERAFDWLLEQAVLLTRDRELAAQYFPEVLAKAEKEKFKMMRCKRILDLSRIASRLRLDLDPETTGRLEDLKKTLAQLTKEPDLRKEAAAYSAYVKVNKSERKNRNRNGRRMNIKSLINIIDRAIDGYAHCLESYPGTRFAEKAARRIKALEKEKANLQKHLTSGR